MKRELITCDLCGNELLEHDRREIALLTRNIFTSKVQQTIDICGNCFDELINRTTPGAKKKK